MKKISTGIFLVLLACSAVLTAAGFLGRFGWLFDLTSYFRVSYFLVQVLCIIFFAVFRNARVLSAALFLAAVNFILIISFYARPFGGQAVNRDTAGLFKVIAVNVNTSNRDYEALLKYVQQVSPDIFALDEIDKTWFDVLAKRLDGYRFKRYASCGECDGIGLFSKQIPFVDKVLYFSESRIPAFSLMYKIGPEEFAFVFTHSICPDRPEYFHRRNRHLKELALFVRRFTRHFMLIGDLNTGPWSYYYDLFLTRAGLRDGRRGFGISATWRMNCFLSAMIDQCLVKEGLIIFDYKIGPGIGSDHYPLYCEAGIKISE